MVFPEGSSVVEMIFSLPSPCRQGRDVGLEKGNIQFGEVEPKGHACDLQRVLEQMSLFLRRSDWKGCPDPSFSQWLSPAESWLLTLRSTQLLILG